MNQELLRQIWDESWGQGIWIAPWAKALGDLTPEQAAWSPAPGRHSIWQIVQHVCVWREHTMLILHGWTRTIVPPNAEENFRAPAKVGPAEWADMIARLRRTHEQFAAALTRPGISMERLPYHLGHDCYHLGQIMYLRALQGLPVIE